MLISIIGFLLSLLGWGLCYGISGQSEGTTFYIGTMFLLGIISYIATKLWNKSVKNQALTMIMAALTAIGSVIAYRVGQSEEFFWDTIMVIGVCAAGYWMIRCTNIYRSRMVQYAAIILGPLILLSARLMGPTGGAYITTFFHIMIFGVVVLDYCFVAAHFLSQPEHSYFGGKVTCLSVSLTIMLVYTAVLFGISALINNEYSMILVLGVSGTVLFMIRCRSIPYKITYSVICAGSAILASRCSTHIAGRVAVWLNPEKTMNLIQSNPEFASRYGCVSETVLYLYRHIHRAGWYGNGLGSLSSKIYTTLNTDHTLVTIAFEMGMVIAVMTVFLLIMYVKGIFTDKYYSNSYDQNLALTSAIVAATVTALTIASQTGSFITSGVGTPFVSKGVTSNAMLAMITVIHMALYEKGRCENAN